MCTLPFTRAGLVSVTEQRRLTVGYKVIVRPAMARGGM